MRCGDCGGTLKVSKVVYTPGFVRRRRACQQCGRAWTTRERFDGAYLERDGTVKADSGSAVQIIPSAVQ